MKSRSILAVAGIALMGLGVGLAAPASAAEPLTVSPSTVSAPGSTTVSGSGCSDRAGGGAVFPYAVPDGADPSDDANWVAVSQGAADENGNFSVALPLSGDVIPGNYDVFAECVLYFDDAILYGPAALFVSPPANPPSGDTTIITNDPDNNVSGGQQLGLEALGFGPGSEFSVFIYSSPQFLSGGFADQAGKASASVTIPSGLEGGLHTIVIFGKDAQGNVFTATKTVNVLGQTATTATTAGRGGTGATIARTGATGSEGAGALLGFALVAIGGACVWQADAASRRRRYAHRS